MQEEGKPGAVVAQGGFDYVTELRNALVRGGLAAEIVRPPKEHCGT
jgi:hypothetical protein